MKKSLIFTFLIIFLSCVPQIKDQKITPDIPKVKVLLNSITDLDSIYFNGTYFMESEEARYEFGKNNKKVFLTPVSDGFKVFNDNRLFLFRRKDRVSFFSKDQNATISYGGNNYSGYFKISLKDSSHLLLVNELDVETYLKGVVPAEIFTDRDDLTEAIKAQAVCARSYVIKKIEKSVGQSFHVYANVKDQTYKGAGIRTKLGDKGVDETLGSILMYGREVADTYYHASCGGILENAENVWTGTTRLYLKSHQDIIGNEFADIESPYYRWTEERTSAQLDTMYNYNFGISHLDDIVTDTTEIPLSIKVRERYPSGRIKSMQVNYGSDQQILSNYEIRKFLGWPQGKLLPSTLINFSVSDSSLIIHGAGNGHGVGMCQFGAMYKSQKGLKYYHILLSYFPGTTLKKIY